MDNPVQTTTPAPEFEVDTTPADETPRDLSPRVVSLARIIDRLPDGEYTISIDKKRNRWAVSVNQSQAVRFVELWR